MITVIMAITAAAIRITQIIKTAIQVQEPILIASARPRQWKGGWLPSSRPSRDNIQPLSPTLALGPGSASLNHLTTKQEEAEMQARATYLC